MAESGQSDSNLSLPDSFSTPQEDYSPEWGKERSRMRSYITKTLFDRMSIEEKDSIVLGRLNERYFYCRDWQLISKYESLGGKWSEALKDRYVYKGEVLYPR